MSKIKLSDYIAKRLKEHGVNHFFMVSGGGAMHLNDSLGHAIPYTACHHEQACSFAAEGYARVNQQLAVVNVTTGPGGLNCLNGLFGQWTDSVPVLYISGQVKRRTMMESFPELNLRQLGDQEVDVISVVKSLTKYAVTVTEPNEIKYHIDKAIYYATTGRFGPVWINVPIDVQAAVINENELIELNPHPQHSTLKEEREYCASSVSQRANDGGFKPFPSEGVKGNEFLVPLTLRGGRAGWETLGENVLNKLANAKRPLIIAGHGIRLSGQIDNFRKFVQNSKIPVVLTFNGCDILETSNPYNIGKIGTIGQRAGNFTLQNADLLLCLGTRNNIRQISYNWENFGKNAYKIVVDIDENELNKPLVKPDLSVCDDLKVVIPQLLENVRVNCDNNWLKFCQNLKEKYSFKNTEEYQQNEKAINPYAFTRLLTAKLGKNDTIVSANATPSICLFQAGNFDGQRLIMNSGNASMGYALPAAIGACYQTEGRVIAFEGDGSIMMNIQELQTIKHNNLPIKIFIINNAGYSSIRQSQKNFFNGRMTGSGKDSGISVPDFANVAQAFGIKAIKIDNPLTMDSEIERVLTYNDAIVCEVITSDDYIFTPKLSSRTLSDGTMVSPSLEDMFPFLPDEELKTNMPTWDK
ncbi:thiamine pyrophosphate-binding protein [bacterium]|nr:thiamine pyrophosphate-binding protein [bacterium]